ncbi:MAG: cellulase family glycosylhydrolase [Planctomycetes bacterium]|nr:cellulase family glycosylhydrolase [Planctomycetota bacterium]
MTPVFFSALLCLAGTAPSASPADAWWARGADRWYYKDDWKGQAISGGRAFTATLSIPDGGASGWIVVWGDRGYRLSVNGRFVGACIDGGLIDDYDLTPFVAGAPSDVTIRIEGAEVCAEGEIAGRDGRRFAFATGADWKADRGAPRVRRMTVGPSQGAFHRAHNGRLMTYNEEERGKTSIAKALARIQKLREQGLFLMRRVRPPAEILAFDPALPWRRAEAIAATRCDAAGKIVREQAIPAQKAGRFADAIASADDAATLIAAAEAPVDAATALYRAEREIAHLENVAILLGAKTIAEGDELSGLRRRASLAREAHAFGDWATCRKMIDRLRTRALGIRAGLEAAAGSPIPWGLDEFPEDRFGWLNARALIGSDPSLWPFAIVPSSTPWIDLAGFWEFRTGREGDGDENWRTILAPRPWERCGVLEDDPASPGDCPYRLDDRRCGDKPYNGFAWYRKRVAIPATWEGKKVILATGKIQNWGRIFINGGPIGDGRRDPPPATEIPADRIRFGAENRIAIQVYNHDNFGGIIEGPLALYVEGSAPEIRETPAPMGHAREAIFATPDGSVRIVSFASAMSPAVIVATDGPALELRGWEAKGFPLPVEGALRAEPWILLAPQPLLLVLESEPRSIAWETNPLGSRSLVIRRGADPIRAGIIVFPANARIDEAECRFWARALRRYPVSASQVVRPAAGAADPLVRRFLVRANYLDIGGIGGLEPLTVAPAPMLLAYGIDRGRPDLHLAGIRATSYRSEHAPYLVADGTDTIEYRAPLVDRSKVLKGVGELFGKMRAEHNMRGGLSEEAMFRRMAEWGFDHCRYAFAFHAQWDIPLVRHVGGPLLENEPAWRRLDEIVGRCNAAGMQMMLCWFFNEDAPQRDAGGAVRNSTRYWRARPETKTNAFELWRRIAARYAGLPARAISYDFFNEPAYINPAHWNEIMRELTAAIRSVDRTHLIVWESADGWAQPQWCAWMEPVEDANVLYSFHHYGKHWGYAYDEYHPSDRRPPEGIADVWLEAILFGIRHRVPIHCGEFGISMLQPAGDGEAWLEDYLAFFERFGIGWNWWNYSGADIYRTGLAAGDRTSPFVPILRAWMARCPAGPNSRTDAARRGS